MKYLKLISILFLAMFKLSYAQQKISNKAEIKAIIAEYSRCVIERDSVGFYKLFNDGPVVWAGAVKERSQAKEIEKNGADAVGSNYFSGNYKGFMKALYSMKASEDKFDNVHITEDGTVASVTMDYSFWKDHKMSNWGGKYLSLINIDGSWKITSVVYSIELTKYCNQPSLNQRKKQYN